MAQRGAGCNVHSRLASDDLPDPDAGLSLREALASADANPGADTIEFSAAASTRRPSSCTQGELTIASDVTIDGGELGITIDANRESRVLQSKARGRGDAGRPDYHRRSADAPAGGSAGPGTT